MEIDSQIATNALHINSVSNPFPSEASNVRVYHFMLDGVVVKH